MTNWKTWLVAIVGVCTLAAPAAYAQAPKVLTAQDYADIQQLMNRYMFALDFCDHGKPYNYADLYTDDGVFRAGHAAGENNVSATGRAALSGYGKQPDGTCSPTSVRGPKNNFHFNIGAVIEPSPEGARGKSYLLMLHGVDGQIRYAGWYEDVYVKTPNGWRFKSRNHRTDYSILYDARVPGADKEPGFNDLGKPRPPRTAPPQVPPSTK